MRSTTYTPEFRAEAVKLVLAQGLTLEEAAQRIAMPKGTLANWVSAAKRGTDPAAPPGAEASPNWRPKWPKLRKELAVERMEKDVLKRPPRTLRGSRCPVRVHEIGATRLSSWLVVPRFWSVA
jgi:transposase